jgi:hypothetical protein
MPYSKNPATMYAILDELSKLKGNYFRINIKISRTYNIYNKI